MSYLYIFFDYTMLLFKYHSLTSLIWIETDICRRNVLTFFNSIYKNPVTRFNLMLCTIVVFYSLEMRRGLCKVSKKLH